MIGFLLQAPYFANGDILPAIILNDWQSLKVWQLLNYVTLAISNKNLWTNKAPTSSNRISASVIRSRKAGGTTVLISWLLSRGMDIIAGYISLLLAVPLCQHFCRMAGLLQIVINFPPNMYQFIAMRTYYIDHINSSGLFEKWNKIAGAIRRPKWLWSSCFSDFIFMKTTIIANPLKEGMLSAYPYELTKNWKGNSLNIESILMRAGLPLGLHFSCSIPPTSH